MKLAHQEAQQLRHEYIGTEHILLGLVREGSGVAANVIRNLNVDLRDIRLAVEKLVITGPEATKGEFPLTPRARRVIEHAAAAARKLNHHYIGSEHLLLGLLREQEAVAAHVLASLGVTSDKAMTEILDLVGPGLPAASQETTIEGSRRRPGPLWRVVAIVALYFVVALAVAAILLFHVL